MPKTEYVSLRLEDTLLARLDTRAAQEDRSRAAIVRNALDSYLPAAKRAKKAAKRAAKKAGRK
jgi:predicted transcriptional regulator